MIGKPVVLLLAACCAPCRGGITALTGLGDVIVVGTEIAPSVNVHNNQTFDQELGNLENPKLGYSTPDMLGDYFRNDPKTVAYFESLDIVVFPGHSSVDYIKLCNRTSVLVREQTRFFPGYFFFLNEEFQKPVNMSCMVLETKAVDPQIREALTWERVEVELYVDRSEYVESVLSWPFMFYSRFLAPCLFFIVFVKAIHIMYDRYRLGTLKHIMFVILLLNSVQSVLIGLLHLFGCIHYGPGSCSKPIHVAFWSELMGLSMSTDLLFANLLLVLSEEMLGVVETKSRWGCTNIYCIFATAAFIGVADIILLLLTAMKLHAAIVERAVAIVLFGFQVHVVLVLLYSIRQLRLTLGVVLASGMNTGKVQPKQASQAKLAQRFTFYGRLSVLSALGVVLASILFLVGSQKYTYIFFPHVVLIDLSKWLNLYSQTRVLASPRVTGILPSISLRKLPK